jgi:hypothetical protein
MYRADALEQRVWTTFLAVLQQPEILTARLASHQTALGVRDVEVQSEVEYLRRELASVTRKEQKLLDLYLGNTAPSEAVRARLDALAAQGAGLRLQLLAAESRVSVQAVAVDQADMIRARCAEIVALLAEPLPLGEEQALLRAFVEKIVVTGDTLDFYGVLPGLGSPPVGELSTSFRRTVPRGREETR